MVLLKVIGVDGSNFVILLRFSEIIFSKEDNELCFFGGDDDGFYYSLPIDYESTAWAYLRYIAQDGYHDFTHYTCYQKEYDE